MHKKVRGQNTRGWRFAKFGILIAAIFATVATAGVALGIAIAAPIYRVDSVGDEPDLAGSDNACKTALDTCTLRAAIQQSNSRLGLENIHFDIFGAGPHVIAPSSVLPTILGPVSINGFTQNFSSSNTQFVGNNSVMKIVLDGSLSGSSDGLVISGGGSTVTGLVISKFQMGIALIGTGGNFVRGNFIGVDYTGTLPAGNRIGVYIESAGNTVGGASPADRNVISAQVHHAVHITRGANGNKVQGNYIGTNAAGTANGPEGKLGNGLAAILIDEGAYDNWIGVGAGLSTTSAVYERNLVSGNRASGIVIRRITDDNTVGDTRGNTISGNYIGVLLNGTHLGNEGFGIQIDGSRSNRIGVVDSRFPEYERNFIAANQSGGIYIAGNCDIVQSWFGPRCSPQGTRLANFNAVFGNYIGASSPWTCSYFVGQPGTAGVHIAGLAESNIIGTDGDGSRDLYEGNVISRNYDGVRIEAATSTKNRIAGNFIGVVYPYVGDYPCGNVNAGVRLLAGANSNIVGTDGDKNTAVSNNSAERNIISDNFRGVEIGGSGTDNSRVAGNYIGTNTIGMQKISNSDDGVLIFGDAAGNVIGTNLDGTADAYERNVISGNLQDGIEISSDPPYSPTENVVRGNYIGITAAGSDALGNGVTGIFLKNAHDNRIGGGVTTGEERDSGKWDLRYPAERHS